MTELIPRQLRKAISEQFSSGLKTNLLSVLVLFGFKYGLPLDADLVFVMSVSCQTLIMILHFVTSQVWIKRF